MKIALLGYGKMGRIIEEVAQDRGHEIVLRIDAGNRSGLSASGLKTADVAIEFSTPQTVIDNILLCFEAQVPVVAGTTGWYDQLKKISKECFEHNGSLVYASNFSVGVNMLFALSSMLAKWMNRFPEYQVSIEEVHHVHKLDAPSGTAISLAEGALKELDPLGEWKAFPKGEQPENSDKVLPIIYEREDAVPGIHRVSYTSEIDRIQISHEAFNRKGFALGAVLAAEFLRNKTGIYTTHDIFKF